MPPALILASASPRRRELLAQAGYTFSVHAAFIDEARRGSESPAAYVTRLALEKAQVIFELHPRAVVLGADTTVVCDRRILNKPTDRDEAERMLRLLAHREHHVHTGIAVVSAGFAHSHVETTQVHFGPIDEADLQTYLDTGDSLDKAGAYGIQGYAARWIPCIDGCFFNVMGLPIAATVKLLHEANI